MNIQLNFYRFNNKIASLSTKECLEASLEINVSDASLLLELERYPWVSQVDMVGLDDPTNPTNYLMFYVEEIDVGITATISGKHVFYWYPNQTTPDLNTRRLNRRMLSDLMHESLHKKTVGWELIPPEGDVMYTDLNAPPVTRTWRDWISAMQGYLVYYTPGDKQIEMRLQPQMERGGDSPKVYANQYYKNWALDASNAPKLPGNQAITDTDPDTLIRQTIRPKIIHDQIITFFKIRRGPGELKRLPYGPPEKGLFFDREAWIKQMLDSRKDPDKDGYGEAYYLVEAHLPGVKSGRPLSGSERLGNPLVHARMEPTRRDENSPGGLAVDIKSVEDWLAMAAAEKRKMIRWLKKQPTEEVYFNVQTPLAYTYTPSRTVHISTNAKDYIALLDKISLDLKNITNGSLSLSVPQKAPDWRKYPYDYDENNGETDRQTGGLNYPGEGDNSPKSLVERWFLLDYDGAWFGDTCVGVWFNEYKLRKMVEEANA